MQGVGKPRSTISLASPANTSQRKPAQQPADLTIPYNPQTTTSTCTPQFTIDTPALPAETTDAVGITEIPSGLLSEPPAPAALPNTGEPLLLAAMQPTLSSSDTIPAPAAVESTPTRASGQPDLDLQRPASLQTPEDSAATSSQPTAQVADSILLAVQKAVVNDTPTSNSRSPRSEPAVPSSTQSLASPHAKLDVAKPLDVVKPSGVASADPTPQPAVALTPENFAPSAPPSNPIDFAPLLSLEPQSSVRTPNISKPVTNSGSAMKALQQPLLSESRGDSLPPPGNDNSTVGQSISSIAESDSREAAPQQPTFAALIASPTPTSLDIVSTTSPQASQQSTPHTPDNSQAPTPLQPEYPSALPMPPESSLALNTAKLIQRASQSEMTIGMHSAEFGSISIRTSSAHDQISAEVSLDHTELGKALAAHLPELRSASRDDRPLDIRITSTSSATAHPGDDRSSADTHQQHGQRQQQTTFAQTDDRSPTFPAPFITSSPISQTSAPASRLDVRV